MKIETPLEVGLTCDNIDTMIDFYSSIFGFEKVGDISVDEENGSVTSLSTSGYRVVRLQSPFGERLKLLSATKAPIGGPIDTASGVINRRNFLFLAFIVPDITKALADIEKANGFAVDSPTTIRDGMKMAVAKDPEGNPLEIIEFKPLSNYRSDL